jgi:hypothetical protein
MKLSATWVTWRVMDYLSQGPLQPRHSPRDRHRWHHRRCERLALCRATCAAIGECLSRSAATHHRQHHTHLHPQRFHEASESRFNHSEGQAESWLGLLYVSLQLAHLPRPKRCGAVDSEITPIFSELQRDGTTETGWLESVLRVDPACGMKISPLSELKRITF